MPNDDIEIDLRQIIRTLLKYRFWILGGALVIGLFVFIFIFIQPRAYKSTAVVTIDKQTLIPNFDPAYQSVSFALTNSLVVDIAKGDEIAYSVYQLWNDPSKEKTDFSNFVKNNLLVETGKTSSVVYLSVKLSSGEEASKLANYWAQQVVQKINAKYGSYNQEDLAFFENEVASTTQELGQAEQALIEFAKTDETASLQNELNGLLAKQQDLLQRQRSVSYLQRDSQTYLDQLRNFPDTATLPPGEYLKLMVLQLRVYGDSTGTNLSDIQLQLSGLDGSDTQTVGEARSSIQELQSALEIQSSDITESLAQYPQNIIELQTQIEILKLKGDRLELEKQLAQDQFSILTKEYEEVKIGIPENSKISSIIAASIPPTKSESRNTLRNTLIGTAAGAFLMILGILIWEWWRKDEKTEANNNE